MNLSKNAEINRSLNNGFAMYQNGPTMLVFLILPVRALVTPSILHYKPRCSTCGSLRSNLDKCMQLQVYYLVLDGPSCTDPYIFLRNVIMRKFQEGSMTIAHRFIDIWNELYLNQGTC